MAAADLVAEEIPEEDIEQASMIDEMLNLVKYDYDNEDDYVPSDFALEFVNFIKLVNGTEGEENLTPVLHFRMLDQVRGKTQNITNMLFRGSAKTTLLGEYLFLYLGVYGKLPDFGDVKLAIYVSDSIDNGVKNMRKNLEYRREKSEFLMQYIPKIKFTDTRWEFINSDGNRFIVKGYGAKTGVRGTKELGVRPTLAVLDDLVSDEDARSETVIASIEDTVDKAIEYAMHPTRKKIIWSGTPFNARDPLYKAVESGAWAINLFPVCEKFPCTREEFRGAWEDRFPYEYVVAQYDKARKQGKIDTFNQELMLRIMSEEERLIKKGEILWYQRKLVLQNRNRFNFYITTDFATKDKQANDYSVISVWALSSSGDWYYVDGVCKKQLMDQNIKDLFRFVQIYKPQQVGIEVSGQQGGFIQWIQNEMVDKDTYFSLASDKNEGAPGIKPTTNKLERFNIVVPWFKMHKIHWPEELKDTPELREAMNELGLATIKGFKSKNDDFIDTISQLANLQTWRPSHAAPKDTDSDIRDPFDDDEMDEDDSDLDSYIV